MKIKILLLSILVCFFISCQNDNVQPDMAEQNSTPQAPDTVWKARDTLKKEGVWVAMDEAKGGLFGQVRITVNNAGEKKSTKKRILIDGVIKDAHLYDLNSDGKMEVYLFNTGEGTGAFGSIIAYQYDKGKLDSIQVDASSLLTDAHYNGKDSFYIHPPYVYRQYPQYNEGDANCCPSGGKKTIAYQLVRQDNLLILQPRKKN